MGKALLRWGGAVAVVAWLVFVQGAAPVRAGDVETAKQRLASAKENLKDQSWGSIEDNLKAAEEFLDGVPDAEKAPIMKEITAIRAQAEPQVKAYKAKGITDPVGRYIDTAAGEVKAVPDRALSDLKEASDRLNSEDGKKYVDPATAKALQTRIAGIQQMAMKAMKGRIMENVDPLMKELEAKVAGDPFKGKDSREVDSIGQSVNGLASRVRGSIRDLPADDPDVKSINARLAAVEKKIEAAAGASEKAGVIGGVVKYWASTKEAFAGWDQEKPLTTWQQYTTSQSSSDLQMPKTVQALHRAQDWLGESQVKEVQAKYGTDPTFKPTVDEATRTVDQAGARLNDAYNKVMDDADKQPTPEDKYSREKPQFLANDVERIFKGTKYMDANVARAKKLQQKWEGAVAAAEEARQAEFKRLVAKASADWPAVASSVSAEDGFNPAEADKWKGKTIRLKQVENVSGSDYTATYDFAAKVNGLPVAGNFAPNIKAALDEVYEKINMRAGDDPWDVIAVVEGPGKINERTRDQVLDGTRTIATINGTRPVDCTVVRVIGLHAGPVAIGPNGSAVGAASGAGSGGVLGTIFRVFKHLVELLICLLAAGAVWVKSRAPVPAAVAVGAPAGEASGGGGTAVLNALPPQLTGDGLSYAGLAFAALGVIWLLVGLIYQDLLPAAALTAAGLFVAGDLLRAKKVLPANTATQLTPLAVPLAAAVAVLGFLHLFLWNWPLF
jgi:hypothetical protein